MLALNVFLFVSAMLLTKTKGGLIKYDGKSFILNVMENDHLWTPVLHVNINVDLDKVPYFAKKMVNQLVDGTKFQPPSDSSETPKSENPSDSQESPESPKARNVAVLNALNTVAEIVSLRFLKSDTVELGLAVIASAVKCTTLEFMSTQMRAIRKLFEKEKTKESLKLRTIWDNLIQYLNKLGRLKDSLEIESDMFHEWRAMMIEAGRTDFASGKMTKIVAGLETISKLINDSFASTCESHEYHMFESKLKLDATLANWDTVEGLMYIFNRCEEQLNETFATIPVETMKVFVWNDFLMVHDFNENNPNSNSIASTSSAGGQP